MPQIGRAVAQRLVRGDVSGLSDGGQTAWGAQYLLIVSSSRRSLPQAGGVLESFALSLDSQPVTAEDGSIVARGNESHTGIASTASGALSQAAQRRLDPIIKSLQ